MAPSVMPQPTTATAPFLEFRNVGHVFQTRRGPFEALRDIDLTVTRGDFVCVIGHAG